MYNGQPFASTRMVSTVPCTVALAVCTAATDVRSRGTVVGLGTGLLAAPALRDVEPVPVVIPSPATVAAAPAAIVTTVIRRLRMMSSPVHGLIRPPVTERARMRPFAHRGVTR